MIIYSMMDDFNKTFRKKKYMQDQFNKIKDNEPKLREFKNELEEIIRNCFSNADIFECLNKNAKNQQILREANSILAEKDKKNETDKNYSFHENELRIFQMKKLIEMFNKKKQLNLPQFKKRFDYLESLQKNDGWEVSKYFENELTNLLEEVKHQEEMENVNSFTNSISLQG